MVGEIRDLETAEIAIRAALTGHLVFSTLHTNDAPSAITRLIDMGAEDYLIASSLLGVLGAASCPGHLSVLQDGSASRFRKCWMKSDSGAAIPEMDPDRFYEGRGCEQCSNTGFIGRIGIYELMPINDDIRKLTVAKADSNQIRKKALENGMRSLRDDGWLKVRQGISSIAEVLRVTQEEA